MLDFVNSSNSSPDNLRKFQGFIKSNSKILEQSVTNTSIANRLAVNKSCDGRVVKASDSKSDGVTRTGSNPVRSEFFFLKIISLNNKI